MSNHDRAEIIAGMRELADWLEANPDVPVDRWHKMDAYVRNVTGKLLPVPDAVLELHRIGAVIGVKPSQQGPHAVVVGPKFRGGVRYEATVCNVDLDDYQPDGTTVACACGCHNAQATDLAQGEGEVAGSLAGDPATAAADGELPRVMALQPIRDRALPEPAECPGLPLPVGDAVPVCGHWAAHHQHRVGESIVYRSVREA